MRQLFHDFIVEKDAEAAAQPVQVSRGDTLLLIMYLWDLGNPCWNIPWPIWLALSELRRKQSPISPTFSSLCRFMLGFGARSETKPLPKDLALNLTRDCRQ